MESRTSINKKPPVELSEGLHKGDPLLSQGLAIGAHVALLAVAAMGITYLISKGWKAGQK